MTPYEAAQVDGQWVVRCVEPPHLGFLAPDEATARERAALMNDAARRWVEQQAADEAGSTLRGAPGTGAG